MFCFVLFFPAYEERAPLKDQIMEDSKSWNGVSTFVKAQPT